ncbi:MAG: DUF697 domain-containing protein, partial [Candidatus Rokuibacteriota bacterium]
MSGLARLALLVALLLLVCVAAFVANQTAQVVALASTVSPAFGRSVLVALLVVYAALVLVPILLFLRLPRALRPPADDQSPAFEAYVAEIGARLARHPDLLGHVVPRGDRAAVEAALHRLDTRAEEAIRSAATTVFLSTAISQNGRLDGLMVLVAQSRLVWRLAHLYDQRPSLRDLALLYANVAATVFLVSELEDMDIEQQVEPVVASALAGSMVSLVPGASLVATVIVQSILDGAANAFLTLRIGVMCQRYCGSLTAVDRRGVRRFASVRAARMLGGVVGASAGVVSRAVVKAARRAGAGTVGTVAG